MKSHLLIGLSLVFFAPALNAQEAASASAIEQSRLFETTPAAPIPAVDADGNVIADTSNSEDDSFGAQMILKEQERVRPFTLSGGAAFYYTNNVALTRRDTREDVFAVLSAAGSWNKKVSQEIQASVGLQAATFRYNDSSQLNFTNLGAGLGLSWTPPRWNGVGFFGQYDFTELIDRNGHEILRDHQFSGGGQKVFALGRAHAVVVGVLGSVGISQPSAAQRDQIGGFAGYHLRLTRALETDLTYRLAYQVYNGSSRQDFNQVFSATLRYHLAEWAEASAFFSYGGNRSNTAAFDYDVISSGGGVGFTTRF